jgi:hypothetical protein
MHARSALPAPISACLKRMWKDVSMTKRGPSGGHRID